MSASILLWYRDKMPAHSTCACPCSNKTRGRDHETTCVHFIAAACHPDSQHYSNGLCKRCYFRKHTKQWRQAHPARAKELVASGHLKRRFGLTPKSYAVLLEAQGGVCKICQQLCTTGRRLTCGKCIRGLLCRRCNQLLGIVNDSVELLKSAIGYLGEGEQQ